MENSGSSDGQVPHLDFFVDENDAEKTAITIAKTVRPEWNEEELKVKVFTGGISNKLLGCYVPTNQDDVVLCRIYGKKTELLVDRRCEMQTFGILNKVGCGPKLYASFKNGIAYEFVPGVTLDDKMVVDENIYPLIAKEVARIHSIKPANVTASPKGVFDNLRKFISLHPTQFDDPKKQEMFQTCFMLPDELEKEVKMLEDTLIPLGSPMVYSHNDLLLGNIIYNKDKSKVTFIDYEFAMYNYQAYDIGNHFNEFVGIEGIDYDSSYPKKEFQLKWMKIYLQALYTARGENKAVTSKELEKMYSIVNKFALVSHLYCAAWAVVQAYHSTIDFDFMEYAVIRMDEYKRKKDEFMSIPIPE